MAPELVRTGVLARAEHATLAGYCLAWAQVQEAKKEVERLGLVIVVEVEDKDGNFHVTGVRKNPACTILDAALKQLRAFGAELGLSPASRSKVGALHDPDDEDDRAAKYFKWSEDGEAKGLQ